MDAKNDSKEQLIAEAAKIDLLIVDDETDFRESACRYLKRLGFQVDEAEDGEEALNITVNRKFDVVILDIHMPGISGIETTQKIRAFNKDIPIIALTAVTIDENLDELGLLMDLVRYVTSETVEP